MVKIEFTSRAAEGYQGFVGEQVLNIGNAFAGAADKAAYDREMFNALHAASILGDEATMPSNIANAQLRMTAATSETGTRKKGGANEDSSFARMMIFQQLQELLKRLDQDIADLDDRIGDMDRILNEDGDVFRASSRAELDESELNDLNIILEEVNAYRKTQGLEELDDDDYFALSYAERRELLIKARNNANELKNDLVEERVEIAAMVEVGNNLTRLEDWQSVLEQNEVLHLEEIGLSITNNAFDNPKLEEAALEWESEFGELDRYNMNAEQFGELINILKNNTLDAIEAREVLSAELEEPTQIAQDLSEQTISGLTIRM